MIGLELFSEVVFRGCIFYPGSPPMYNLRLYLSFSVVLCKRGCVGCDTPT